MPRRLPTFLIPVFCLVLLPDTRAQDAAQTPETRVELRWVETTRIPDVTEDAGIQSSCDPDDVVYPHRKPALVLTAAEISEARLTRQNIAGGTHYLVTLHLTQEARDRLAAACDSDGTRLLTVMVNGRPWGVRRYEKNPDQPFVPAQARAATFTPDVGFFSSRFEAQRLVDAFRPKHNEMDRCAG